MIELIVTVGVVVLVSALCSLSEAALYSVPLSHVESLAQSRSPRGQALKELRSSVDRPIAALLSLNTIANTGGAAIAGALADHVFGTRWMGLFSAGFTLAILLFSEIIPKTIGVVHCRPVAERLARPLQLLVRLFKPLVWLSGWVTGRVGAGRTTEEISENEIAVMTKLGLKRGVIDQDEAMVIQNILALETKTVRDVLTPRTVLFALPADAKVREAHKDPHVLTHSRIPVYFKNLDDIGGLVYRRDILTAGAEDRYEQTLEMLMRPVHFVPAKMRLNRTLRLFLERGEHMFVVVDEFGGTSGVVTLEDVLEEIIGKEIVDEFDEVADLRKLAQMRRQQAQRADDEKRRPPRQG